MGIAKHTRVELVSRKIQTYQNKTKNLCRSLLLILRLTWTVNANSLGLKQNIIVIKEIMFLAATFL